MRLADDEWAQRKEEREHAKHAIAIPLGARVLHAEHPEEQQLHEYAREHWVGSTAANSITYSFSSHSIFVDTPAHKHAIITVVLDDKDHDPPVFGHTHTHTHTNPLAYTRTNNT